jgi:uncharacterized protein DUF3592
MRLWGKLVSGGMLLIAAVFTVIAVVQPEARAKFATVAVLLAAAALFGVPVFVRFFGSVLGDEEILANGIAGSATITSIAPTAWSYNQEYSIVKFKLNVEAGGATYPVEHMQAVEPEVLERLAPGSVVAVRVHREDHKKVAIDWGEPGRSAADPAVTEPAEQRQAEVFSGGWYARVPNKKFFALGLLLFGLIFFRLSCEEDYYEKGGVRVQGVVLKKTYVPERHTMQGERSSSKRYLSYRFTTKEGQTIEGRYDVLPDAYEKAREGDPIVVEYLSDSPGTNRIPEQRARSKTFGILSAVLLAASVVVFIIGRRQRPAPAK